MESHHKEICEPCTTRHNQASPVDKIIPLSLQYLVPLPAIQYLKILPTQLITETYLTQSRLYTIKKTTSKNCQLCKEEEEENTTHFVARCPRLTRPRQTLLDNLRRADIQQSAIDLFQPGDPESFVQAVLFPCDIKVASPQRDAMLKTTLSFIYQIHSARAATIMGT